MNAFGWSPTMPSENGVETLPEVLAPPPLPLLDDDDEAAPEPSFSMEEHLRSEVRFTGHSTMVEVFRLHGQGVKSHQPLKRGARAAVGPDAEVAHLEGGLVKVSGTFRGTLLRDGQEQDLAALGPDPLTLRLGDIATLHTQHGEFLIRLTQAPATLAEVLKGALVHAVQNPNTMRLAGWTLGASVATHLLMLLGAWIMDLRNPRMQVFPVEDEFRVISIPEPVLEAPVPERPRPVMKEAAAARPQPTPVVMRNRQGAPSPGKATAAGPQLAALDRLMGKSQGVAQRVLDAAQAAAAKAPIGSHGYKVSKYASAGPLGGLDSIGQVGDRPKGLNHYASLGGVGGMGGREKSSVRGGVSEAVHRLGYIRPEGTSQQLSAADIAKVVNNHVGEISYCYEVALLHNPGLAGRARVEWTVGPAGNVTQVRTLQSDVGPAMNCILDRIRKWTFPAKPQGKTVVTYPFVFRASA